MNPSDSDSRDSPNLSSTFGGSGTSMRTRSAVSQLPALTPTSPPASPDAVSQRFSAIETTLQQIVQAMMSSQSSPSATTAGVPSPSSPIMATLAAPLMINNIDIELSMSKEYRATQSSVSEGVAKCQINGHNSALHSSHFEDFQRLLSQTHLMTLADGSRKEPTATTRNKYGYTEDSITIVDGESLYVPPDDLGLHTYDLSRLLPLLRAFIGHDLYYMFRADLETGKCTKIFAALVTYIREQSAKDVTIALRNLQSWTLSSSRPFPKDAQNLLDLIGKVEFAQRSPMAGVPRCPYYYPSYLVNQVHIY